MTFEVVTTDSCFTTKAIDNEFNKCDVDADVATNVIDDGAAILVVDFVPLLVTVWSSRSFPRSPS